MSTIRNPGRASKPHLSVLLAVVHRGWLQPHGNDITHITAKSQQHQHQRQKKKELDCLDIRPLFFHRGKPVTQTKLPNYLVQCKIATRRLLLARPDDAHHITSCHGPRPPGLVFLLRRSDDKKASASGRYLFVGGRRRKPHTHRHKNKTALPKSTPGKSPVDSHFLKRQVRGSPSADCCGTTQHKHPCSPTHHYPGD